MVEAATPLSAMIEGVASCEVQPISVSDFTLVVHPFSEHPYSASHPYAASQARLFMSLTQRLVPVHEGAVVAFMPEDLMAGELREKINNAEAVRSRGNLDWVLSYKQARRNSAFRRNVFLLRDLLLVGASELPEMLSEKGFCLGENAVVTLAGEQAEACVSQMAGELLHAGITKQVRIDKEASLLYEVHGLYKRKDRRTTLKDIKAILREWREEFTIDTYEDDDFIYFSRLERI